MNVVSDGSLPVGSVLWQSGAGEWTLSVVARATFVLLPGESPLAPEQDAPHEADRYWNDDERCSLRAADDLVPYKRSPEVLLVGHAYAPHRQPVASLLARMVVGEVDKTVEVFGDRAFALDGSLREGTRFVTMPLYWESAAGGPETSNPVGRRLDVADPRGLTPLPNLQPPGLHVTSRLDFIPPAGFGPIAPWWPPRQSKLHRGLPGWDFRRWKQGQLPADLDPSFFNAAPADQQLHAIRANERIVLDNLHPEHARLVTSLVAVKPRALVELPGGPSHEFGMRCDTITIDTDRGRCALTWRGQIPLDRADDAGRVLVTTARDDARRRASAHTLPASAGAVKGLPFGPPGSAPVDAANRTLDAPLAGALPTLPFQVGRSPLSGTVLGKLPAISLSTPSPDDATRTVVPAFSSARSPVLPFTREGGDERETSPAPAPASPVPPAVNAPPDEEPDTWDVPARAAAPGPPAWSPAGIEVSPDVFAAASATYWSTLDREAPAPPPAPPPVPAPVEAPPAMIGPLATPEMVAASEPPIAEATAVAEAPPPAPAEPPGPPPLPLDRYPLERCAAIAASIARTRSEMDDILADHELDRGTWEALDQHYRVTVQAQAGRGRTAPLKAYDAAYVAQLEKERGPIRVSEYARLLVAEERGDADEALAALTLPPGALLRVKRVWLARVAADPELSRGVRAAVEDAREG